MLFILRVGTEESTIDLPECVDGNIEGLRFMAKCLKKVNTVSENLTFNFANNLKFDLSLTAALGIIVKAAKKRNIVCTMSMSGYKETNNADISYKYRKLPEFGTEAEYIKLAFWKKVLI